MRYNEMLILFLNFGQAETRIVAAAMVVKVVDNGKGIAEDVAERIFIPFFTTKPEGSGIGLSLSRQIIRLHKGTIGVASTPNERTVFKLRF